MIIAKSYGVILSTNFLKEHYLFLSPASNYHSIRGEIANNSNIKIYQTE